MGRQSLIVGDWNSPVQNNCHKQTKKSGDNLSLCFMERIVFAIKTSHYAIKTNELSSKVWSNPSGQQNYSTSPRNGVWNLEVYNLTNFPFFDLMETLIFLYLSTKICNNNNEYKCTNVSYDWMYKCIIWSKNVLRASTWNIFASVTHALFVLMTTLTFLYLSNELLATFICVPFTAITKVIWA